MKLRLITWLIFLGLFFVALIFILEIWGSVLNCCTSLLLNILQQHQTYRFELQGQHRSKWEFCPFPKDKSRMEVPGGVVAKQENSSGLIMVFNRKTSKSNNIHPKCQIAVMLFIMLQNSFKAPKHKKRAEAKSGNALLCVQHMHLKCAGNTIIKGPAQYQRDFRNEYQVNDKRQEWIP